MSVLDDFVRIRAFLKRAAEFEQLANAALSPSVQLRYLAVGRHYRQLADREEQIDKARMAERLKRLRLEREQAAKQAISPVYLIAAE
jgi:hypothetical protein